MSVSTFNLPVLSQSLPQADSIIQVVDVLGQLNAIAEQMFFKIRDKAETQKRIIDSITARINAASAKANQLKKGNKATVIVSPSSYPKQSPSHYQNVFTPLPSKPDLCPMISTVKPNKLGPADIGPSNLNVDLSFATLEKKPRKLSESKYVPNAVNSIDELVPFCIEKPKNKKLTKPKKKEEIDPFLWDDLMTSVSRDSQYRYIPDFQNFPQSKNVPDHLMSDVATNITYEDKKPEESIAPSMLYRLCLPDVGVPVSETVSSQADKPVSPPPSVPTAEPQKKVEPQKKIEPEPQKKVEPEPSYPALPPPTLLAPRPEPSQPRLPMPPPIHQEIEKPITLPLPLPSGVQSAPPPPPPPPMQKPLEPQTRHRSPDRRPPAEEREDFFTQLKKKIEERQKPKPPQQRLQSPERRPRAPTTFVDEFKKRILERRESMIEDEGEEQRRKKEDEDEWSQ